MHVRFFVGFLVFALLAISQVALSQTDSEKVYTIADLERERQAEKISILEKAIEYERKVSEDERNKLESRLKEFQEKNLALYNEKYTRLENRVYLLSGLFALIITGIGFLLNYLGKQRIEQLIDKEIRNTADKYVKEHVAEKVDTILGPIVERDLEKKGRDAISDLVSQFETRMAAQMAALVGEHSSEFEKTLKGIRDEHKETRVEMLERYENVIKELKVKGLERIENFSNSLDVEDKKRLVEFEEILVDAKEEKDYSAEDWFWKGISERDDKKYKQAIHSFTQAIEADKKNPDYWHNRGFVYHTCKDFENALIDYSKAINIHSGKAIFWYNRGCCKHDIEDVRGAIEDYTKALSFDIIESAALVNRGIAWNQVDEYLKAVQDFEKSIEIGENLPEAYANRAFSYIKLGDLEKAETDNQKASQLDLKYGRPHYNEGIILQGKGLTKEACKAWKKALELGFEEAQEMLDEYCNS